MCSKVLSLKNAMVDAETLEVDDHLLGWTEKFHPASNFLQMSCHLWAPLNLEFFSCHNQSSPSWQWHSPRILIISHWKYHKYIYIYMYIYAAICAPLYLTKRLTSTVKVVKHSETTSEILTTYIWWPKILPYSPPKKTDKKKHNTRQSIVYLNFKPTRTNTFSFSTNQPTNQQQLLQPKKHTNKKKKRGPWESTNHVTTSPTTNQRRGNLPRFGSHLGRILIEHDALRPWVFFRKKHQWLNL